MALLGGALCRHGDVAEWASHLFGGELGQGGMGNVLLPPPVIAPVRHHIPGATAAGHTLTIVTLRGKDQDEGSQTRAPTSDPHPTAAWLALMK